MNSLEKLSRSKFKLSETISAIFLKSRSGGSRSPGISFHGNLGFWTANSNRGEHESDLTDRLKDLFSSPLKQLELIKFDKALVDRNFYLGLQKNLYWMRIVTANMTTPWMDMAQRFFPTISQLSGSSKRSSPDKEGRKRDLPPYGCMSLPIRAASGFYTFFFQSQGLEMSCSRGKTPFFCETTATLTFDLYPPKSTQLIYNWTRTLVLNLKVVSRGVL